MKISVEQLGLARGERVLFENLSFEAAAGGFIEVHGANGAGKTSLLRALAGWQRPLAGAIRYDHEAPALAMHVLAHREGLKAQQSALAHVRYWAGLLGGNDALGAEALTRVGLARAAALPARVLSRGQMRRLALTRLIVAPRPLWLLDEPAAGLDEEGKALIASLIADHARGGGTIVASCHEPLGPDPMHVVRL
ncbi:MAG: heme ABC exporter ATP-binding protein CcmA [Hyphomonadaceae bacterium]